MEIAMLGEEFTSHTAAIASVDRGELAEWLDFFDATERMLACVTREKREVMGRIWLLRAADGVMTGLRDMSVSSATFQAWHGLLHYLVHDRPLPVESLTYFAQSGRHAIEALDDRRWYSAARHIVFGGDEREVAFAVASYLDGEATSSQVRAS